MKILLILFLLAFLGLYVILGTIKRVLRMFAPEPEPKKRPQHKHRSKSGLDTRNATQRKKIIPDDEGEYVDFEDVSK